MPIQPECRYPLPFPCILTLGRRGLSRQGTFVQ